MKIWKIKLHIIAEEFFKYSLISYILLLLAETFKEGLVSYFFNLNILLFTVVISGLIMSLTDHSALRALNKPNRLSGKDIEFILLLAAAGTLLIYFKTSHLGLISMIIAGITALIVVLLAVLLISNKEYSE